MSRRTEGLGLRVLIVDDERPARRKVRRFLEADPDVEVVFEAPDGIRALEVIREQEPDLVFLDIQMPGVTGLEVIESLPADCVPQIVFVTAHDTYAVRAFELSAVDYLLKPFDALRFATALNKAKERIGSRKAEDDTESLRRLMAELKPRDEAPLERVMLERAGRSTLVTTRDIDRFEADGNYIVAHVGQKAYRLRSTVADLDGRLDPRQFARVGRGTIINLDRVAELSPAGHGDYDIKLKDGKRVRLSRHYRDRLDRFR